MSKFPFFLRYAPLTAVLAAALAVAASSQVLGSEAAQLDGFTQPDGTNVFALGLKPSGPAVNGPREVA